jgi:hypothetical protein
LGASDIVSRQLFKVEDMRRNVLLSGEGFFAGKGVLTREIIGQETSRVECLSKEEALSAE